MLRKEWKIAFSLWCVALVAGILCLVFYLLSVTGFWHAPDLVTPMQLLPPFFFAVVTLATAILVRKWPGPVLLTALMTTCALGAYTIGDVLNSLNINYWGGAVFGLGHLLYGSPLLAPAYSTSDPAPDYAGGFVLNVGAFAAFPLFCTAVFGGTAALPFTAFLFALYGVTLGVAHFRGEVAPSNVYTRLSAMAYVMFAASDTLVFCTIVGAVTETVATRLYVHIIYFIALALIALEEVQRCYYGPIQLVKRKEEKSRHEHAEEEEEEEVEES